MSSPVPSRLASRRTFARRGFVPRIDGEPHRAWASLNVREDEKQIFDILQSWWCREEQASIHHWDGFSILLHHYLRTADIPPELAALVRD